MGEKSNTNGKSKITMVIVVAVIILVALLAIGTYFILLKLQAKQAEMKVEGIFSSLKSGDENTKNEYLKYDEIFKEIQNSEENNKENANSNEDIIESDNEFNVFFNNLDYKIISSEANFKEAKVVVEVTNKDIGKVFSNYILKAFQLAFQSAFSNKYSEVELDKKLSQYLKEEINSENIEKITNTITIEMVKDGKDWKITTDNITFANAVLPGLIQKINDVQNSFGSSLNSERTDDDTLENRISDDIISSNRTLEGPSESL